MALNIQTQVTTQHGFTVSNFYARVSVTDGPDGKQLQIFLSLYPTVEAFENGLSDFYTDAFFSSLTVPYDRAKDGVDTLAFAHQKAVQYLAEQGINATILLDSLI